MEVTTETRERPILFRGEMVRAILDGRKTQTRRIMKPQPRPGRLGNGEIIGKSEGQIGDDVYHVWQPPRGPQKHSAIPLAHSCMYRIEPECPYGEIGDRLWVRETWALVRFWKDPETGYIDDVSEWRDAIPKSIPSGWTIVRAADEGWDDHRDDRGFNWRPSIHMPREACRLVLEITDVRVEWLNDITPEDAIAEGIEGDGRGMWKHYLETGKFGPSPVHSFQTLWESINGVGSWAANPWVWVVSFRRIDQ